MLQLPQRLKTLTSRKTNSLVVSQVFKLLQQSPPCICTLCIFLATFCIFFAYFWIWNTVQALCIFLHVFLHVLYSLYIFCILFCTFYAYCVAYCAYFCVFFAFCGDHFAYCAYFLSIIMHIFCMFFCICAHFLHIVLILLHAQHIFAQFLHIPCNFFGHILNIIFCLFNWILCMFCLHILHISYLLVSKQTIHKWAFWCSDSSPHTTLKLFSVFAIKELAKVSSNYDTISSLPLLDRFHSPE